MIVEAAQVHILPVSKQPGDYGDGKGKDIKAILLNPQAFVLVHLELKFCGISHHHSGRDLPGLECSEPPPTQQLHPTNSPHQGSGRQCKCVCSLYEPF